MIHLIRFLATAALLAAGCASPAPKAVRVLSYNMHHGEGLDGRLDLERIARVIRDSGADLVALQEVDRGTKRTGRVDQPARLAELTGLQALFGRNIDLEGGAYGNAILSRYPIESHRNHALPNVDRGEQRGMLEALVRIGDTRLLFCSTHFDHRRNDEERLASAAVLNRFADEHLEVPVIIAGDLNAVPDSPVMQEVFRFLRDSCPPGKPEVFTIPAGSPRHRIDYVLFNAHPALRPVDFGVLPEAVASDHRPVFASFTVEQEAPARRPRKPRT